MSRCYRATAASAFEQRRTQPVMTARTPPEWKRALSGVLAPGPAVMAIAFASGASSNPRPEAPVMRISLSPTLSLLPLLAASLTACHNEPIDPANLADL